MTRRIAPAAAALLAAVPLAAQPAPTSPPDAGARVRVVLADRERITGTLVAREPDRWVVVGAGGDSLVFAPGRIERLDVSAARRSASAAFWRGARTGALVGAAVGVTGVALELADDDDCGDPCIFPAALVIGVAGTALTLGTTLVGGMVGSFMRDEWRRVDLPEDVRIGIAPVRGGAALAVRLPLP